MSVVIREYAIPVATTLILHIGLLLWLAMDFVGKVDVPEVRELHVIKASVVELKEKAKPKPAPEPRAVDKSREIAEQKKRQAELKRQQEQKLLEQKRLAEKKAAEERERLSRIKAEEERQRQQELEKQRQEELRKQREAEQARQAREEALMRQLAEQQAREQAANDEATANSYISIIQQAVIANWSRPASARNDMEAVLEIQLVPTGAVVNVTVVKSSGNQAFDRSAVTAVEKAERFPELADMEPRVFEKYFRRLKMRFKPEDLRL